MRVCACDAKLSWKGTVWPLWTELFFHLWSVTEKEDGEFAPTLEPGTSREPEPTRQEYVLVPGQFFTETPVP